MFPENKKIGVDIDETIAQSFLPLLEYINQESGRNIAFDDLTHHDWENIPHIEPRLEREEIITYIQSFDSLFHDHRNTLPVEGSQYMLQQFQSIGYELIAITGRNEEYAKPGTMLWIDKYFPNVFTSVHFTSHISKTLRKNKSVVCKELGVELMIEDSLDFALELADNSIASFLLEKPWNKQRTEMHPLITRVKDWEEIEQKFLTIHTQ